MCLLIYRKISLLYAYSEHIWDTGALFSVSTFHFINVTFSRYFFPFQLWSSSSSSKFCFFKVLLIFDNFEFVESLLHIWTHQSCHLCVNYVKFNIYFNFLDINIFFYISNLFNILTFQFNLFFTLYFTIFSRAQD